MPPVWKVADINCEIQEGIIKDKGSNRINVVGDYYYNENYIILEDNTTIWVSPAMALTYKEGDYFRWPVC